MEACAVICRKATVALLDANPFIFEHINDIFVRFCPSGPLFSGISSTKSRFLCFFGLQNPHFRAFRAQNRGFCARLLNWMSRLGRFPADRGIVAPAQPLHLRSHTTADAPAQPILPLTLPPLHLRSRCTCAAAVPSAVACSRLPPVPPVLPLLAASPAEPLHMRSRYYRSLPPLHLTARAG